MAWKPEYAANRRKKYAEDAAERERRKKQGRTPEQNAEYMKKYYAENREKWKKNEEQRAIRQAKRRAKRAAGYREGFCKENRYMRSALRKYGLTADDYKRMAEEQNHVCAICGWDGGKRKLHVDHCHTTGAIRGLLCHRCNCAIGLMYDDVDCLTKAIAYLLKSMPKSAVSEGEDGLS